MKRFALLLLLLLLTTCRDSAERRAPADFAVDSPAATASYRVYYVNSYHQGYPWSDAIEKSIRRQFKDFTRESGSKIGLDIFRLDSKQHPEPARIEAAALEALAEIRAIKPDIVIVSDDNAVKYLVEPYLSAEGIPVVYCGVNWSSDRYRLPVGQITGMLEVQLVDQIVKALHGTVRGERIAFLKGDDFSARVEAEAIRQAFGLNLDTRLVGNFTAWKDMYLKLQEESDLLILGNSASIADWDDNAALAFVRANTRIPSGGWDQWMARYCLVTFATAPEEQGTWAAQTALRILRGTPVAEIRPTRNKQANIILNMPLAKQLGIRFPMHLIENATLLRE